MKKNTEANLISFLLPNLSGGGAERVAVNLAKNFVQRGFKVDMVLLSAEGELLNELQPEIRIVDLQVKRMRGALLPLVRYFGQTRPKALLANMWPLTVIALWGRILARVPMRTIVAEHTTWSKSEILSSWMIQLLVRVTMHRMFPTADGIVAVSQGAADDLAVFANLKRSAITTIYNPIVGKSLQPVKIPFSPQGWCKGSHRKLLAVGRLKAIKDYETLLDAFAILCQQVNVRLLILGEGECRASLELQAKQLGIEDNVFMPGFVSDPTPYYQHADLCVLSSKAEGFGNVIVEALAAGKPVVSTDCQSGPREILCDGQFGQLVPVGKASLLANAIAESLVKPYEPSLLKARAQDFSIDRAAECYLGLLFPKNVGNSKKDIFYDR